MATKLSNGYLAKSGTAPTRPSGTQSRSDERHDHVRPIGDRRPFPTTGSEADGRGYALQMPVREKTLYKVSLPEQGQKIMPRTPPPGSRQPDESLPQNL
jgi:hypothetical protein